MYFATASFAFQSKYLSSLLYNGYRDFPGGKERPGRYADPSTSFSAVVKK